MLAHSLSPSSIARAGGLALVIAIAIGTAQPSSAAVVRSSLASQSATVTSSDISAARRQHHARRTSPRNAFGSYTSGAGGFVPQSTGGYGYGYGYGDNSRNQTW